MKAVKAACWWQWLEEVQYLLIEDFPQDLSSKQIVDFSPAGLCKAKPKIQNLKSRVVVVAGK
jgi:hypothetical protein